jgi:putrescine transport system permease protein
LVIALVWAWLLLFLVIPALIVLKIAISEAADGIPPYAPVVSWVAGVPHWRGTGQNFALIFSDPLYRNAFLRSLRVAGVSTLICILAGYPMALAIAQAPPRSRNLLLLGVMLPFWTGFLMRINAWIGLLQDDGWINRFFHLLHMAPVRLLYTDTAMYIGIVYTYLPFMVLPLYARLARMDPALLHAAADLGARPFNAFRTVTLPLSLPGLWAGALLVFVPAVGEYVIPELLGGPQAQLVGRVLWEEFFENRDWPTAAALACMLLALLLVVPAVVFGVVSRAPIRSRMSLRQSALAE